MQRVVQIILMLLIACSAATVGAQSPAAPATSATEAAQLKQALEQTQAILREQQETLRLMRQQLDQQASEIAALRTQQAAQATSVEAARNNAAQLQAAVAALRAPGGVTSSQGKPAGQTAAAAPGQPNTQPGELYFRLGSATFTPSGWVDFTALYRSTNVGGGLGTGFGSIPYNNVVAGGQSEVRFSSQSSRLAMRIDQSIGKMKAYGYLEADFLGYLPTNAYVSTNSNTLRMRAYYLDVTRNKWEFLGGQGWSLLTPTRKALSPFLSDLFILSNLDTNYQAGLVFARQAQMRAVYHATPSVAVGLSVENAEQYSGSVVTFPTLFSTTETDINSSTAAGGSTSTPNVHPDVIAKATFDHKFGARTFHVGVAGLLTSTRVVTPATVTKTVNRSDEREGGAVMYNMNAELLKGFRLLAIGYWSDGGGRYIGGLAPGFVVLQQGTATAPFRAALLHTASGIGGFEWQATKKTTFTAYASGVYFQRRYARDAGLTTPTWVGYGYPSSPNSHNRVIEELTAASNTTFWSRPGYGALQIISQASYVQRAPWYVPTTGPRDAHMFMGYMSLRYVIP